MILVSDMESRWKLFEGYSARLMSQDPNASMSRGEWCDFLYLKLYLGEEFLKAKFKPWLPSVFNKGLHERTPK